MERGSLGAHASRDDVWKKYWGKPRALTSEQAESSFENFVDEFVSGHMTKAFLKMIRNPKPAFGNRYFKEDAGFHLLDTPLYGLLGSGTKELPVEVTVILPVGDSFEGFLLRGPARRTIRQIVIDDWRTTLMVVSSDSATIYGLVQPKSKGCIVRGFRQDLCDGDLVADA